MYSLRPYQTKLINQIGSSFVSGHQSVCAVAPCGAGKTVMVGWMAGKTALVGKRVLFLVHRKELIDQSDKTFSNMNLHHGIIGAGISPAHDIPIQIGSTQTVAKRLNKIEKPDFIIIDEAHHATAGTWRKIIDYYPNALILGVTATPSRLDGTGLGDIFNSLVLGPTVDELITLGNLTKFDYYAPPCKADFKSVRIKFGDYVKKDISRIVDDNALVGDVVKKYQELARGSQTVCYCTSREHSKHVVEKFKQAGVPAAFVDGETPSAERSQIIEDFRTKKVKLLCNVDLLGEGFDVPSMDAVILARPTASLTLFIQQSMRPLRPDPDNPNKKAIIIDHVGNCFRHGLPNSPQEWTLNAKCKGRRQDREIPIHQCAKCFQVWGTPSRTCPFCGYTRPVVQREIKIEDGALAKIDSLELIRKKKMRQEVGRARSRSDLETIAIKRGYKFNWVNKMMQIKHIGG